MKAKNLFVMLLSATSLIFFFSCSGERECIEYWKVYIARKYGVENYRTNYLQKRFDSMASNPNEYQKAYYSIADYATLGIDGVHTDDEMMNKVKSAVDDYINDEYLNYHLTEMAKLNMKSHPDLYIENVCKIIGPVDDLKEELASHVDVKKIEKVNVADYKRYNVLYSIDEKHYVICTITETSNGNSEIQVIEDDNSINEILDYWETMHVKL